MMILFIVGCGSLAVKPNQSDLNVDYGIYPDNYQEIAKEYIGSGLKDPYSAIYTFSEPKKGKYPTRPRYAWAICGSVNAKNSFGGYVGVMPFVLKVRDGKVLQYETHAVALSVCDTLSK